MVVAIIGFSIRAVNAGGMAMGHPVAAIGTENQARQTVLRMPFGALPGAAFSHFLRRVPQFLTDDRFVGVREKQQFIFRCPAPFLAAEIITDRLSQDSMAQVFLHIQNAIDGGVIPHIGIVILVIAGIFWIEPFQIRGRIQ